MKTEGARGCEARGGQAREEGGGLRVLGAREGGGSRGGGSRKGGVTRVGEARKGGGGSIRGGQEKKKEN
ncbi:hypothetical protein DPMN_096456 [Dreissena polymorpha]|uniref:Uncharacterized protein n=1 Tax=Dreissena polymorpha TaxID=45954 RepID=A0A9D4R4H4_DREPO|nr:hypothetical protein DPMN_096456 [Dreissena polymorpha]